jgi:excisionase family DNA binding protein
LTSSIYTLREVAEYLKVTERTVYRLLASRSIPAFKVGGSWRFRLTDLNIWIERQTALGPGHSGEQHSTTGGAARAGAPRR